MNENDVGLVGHDLDVLPIDLEEEVPVLGRELLLDAVEGVVHFLGDEEEPLVATDDVPAGLDAQILEEGEHAQEDLGDTASDGCGVDVLDAPALEALGEKAELFDGTVAHDRGVVLNPEHGSALSG